MEMKDKDIKEGLFKRLWKLGEAEDKYKKLSIQQDWTKKEREEENKLHEEARAKETTSGGRGGGRGGDTSVQGARPTPWASKVVQIIPKRDEMAE